MEEKNVSSTSEKFGRAVTIKKNFARIPNVYNEIEHSNVDCWVRNLVYTCEAEWREESVSCIHRLEPKEKT